MFLKYLRVKKLTKNGSKKKKISNYNIYYDLFRIKYFNFVPMIVQLEYLQVQPHNLEVCGAQSLI